MVKKIIFLGFVAISSITSCTKNEVVLTKEDRNVIDTTSSAQITKLSRELDKWCEYSSPGIRKKLIDSLLVVRQAEINKRLGK